VQAKFMTQWRNSRRRRRRRRRRNIAPFLTFGGPCIVIYSYNESQDALFLKFI